MADNSQTTQASIAGVATAAASTTTATSAVVVDKTKTPEQYIKDAEAKYIVPPLVRNKFPDLIKLIYETESMNQEEREYWLQIMPIMTEEQTVKFRDILVNEKNQLEKLDKDYKNEMGKIGASQSAPIDEAKLQEKMQQLKAAEQVSKSSEKSEEEKLLSQLNTV